VETIPIVQLLVYVATGMVGNWFMLAGVKERLSLIEQKLGITDKDLESARSARSKLWTKVNDHDTRIVRLEERP